MKKNWTKVLVALLTLAMILSLTGCPAADQPDESSKAPESSTPETPKETEKETPKDSETAKPTETEKETAKPTETEKETDKPTETQKPTETDKPEKPLAFLNGFIGESDLLDGKFVISADGDYMWEEALKLEGYLGMSGNAAADKSISEFAVGLKVTADAVLSFKVKVDTGAESTYDGFYIIVDGAFYTLDGAVPYADGSYTLNTEVNGWKLGNVFTDMDASACPYVFPDGEFNVAITLTEGQHEVRIGYLKDWAGSANTDKAYISAATLTEYVAPEPPVPEVLVIAYSETGAKLDAYKDAAYANGVEFIINNGWSNNPADYAHNGAKAWVITDGTGLYVYAEVEDSTIYPLEARGDGDMVQVYVDMVNDAAETGLTGTAYKQTGKDQNKKLGICWVGPDGTYTGSWGYGGVAEVAGTARAIDGGYACELYIPFPENVNKLIGIGFEVHDDTDGDGKRNAIWYDRADGGSYWNNYEGLTRYEVAAAGEATVTAIPFSAKGLHLDAYKDVIYGSNAIEVKSPWSGNAAGLEGGGVVYVAHDGTGLYYYAEIADLSILPDADNDLDNSDKAQIYVDFLNNHDGSGLTHNDYRFQEANRNNLGWVNIVPGGAMAGSGFSMANAGFAGAYREIEGGYAVEVYVPFSEGILAYLERGAVTTIGLGWQFDNDASVETPDNNRDSIFTDQENGTAYYNTYEMLRDFIVAPTSEWDGRVAANTETALTIDGVKDEVYGEGWELGYRWTGSNEAAEGQTHVYMAHDAEYLYIFADITDKTPFSTLEGNVHWSDKIQVYIDFMNGDDTLGLTGGYHGSHANYGELSVGYVEVARDNTQRLMYTFNGRKDIVSATAEEKMEAVT